MPMNKLSKMAKQIGSFYEIEINETIRFQFVNACEALEFFGAQVDTYLGVFDTGEDYDKFIVGLNRDCTDFKVKLLLRMQNHPLFQTNPEEEDAQADLFIGSAREPNTPEDLGFILPPETMVLKGSSVPIDPEDPTTWFLNYYDAQDPTPDYELEQQIFGQLNELTPDELQRLANVVYNGQIPGRKSIIHGQDRVSEEMEADPVDLYSGRFTLDYTDIDLMTPEIPLRFKRVYRSGATYRGPLGFNWDHSFNLYVRELVDGGIAFWTGQLSEVVFSRKDDSSYDSPLSFAGSLTREENLGQLRYVILDQQRNQFIFERPEDWSPTEQIPCTSILDRNGHKLTLTYNASLLEKVSDDFGNILFFHYGDCELLLSVTDKFHRGVQYAYDDMDHLIEFELMDDSGKTTGVHMCYEYDRFLTHPSLIHNIIRVSDAKGQTFVQNEYGYDGYSHDFNRVVCQRFGDRSFQCSASRLQFVPQIPEAINIAHKMVEVVLNGEYTVYIFNYRGNLLQKRYRLARDGSYRLCIEEYEYDEQGNRIKQVSPGGLTHHYTFSSENEDPFKRNLLIQTSRSRLGLHDLLLERTYEPMFNLIKSITDAEGNTTTFFYDHEDASIASNKGLLVRIEYPKLTDDQGLEIIPAARFEFNDLGKLKAYSSPENRTIDYTYYQDGNHKNRLKSVTVNDNHSPLSYFYEYDKWGMVARVVDNDQRATEWVYDPFLRLREEWRADAVSRELVEKYEYDNNGYVTQRITPKGDLVEVNESYILNENKIDILGNIRKTTFLANTTRARTEEYCWNHRDELQRLTREDGSRIRSKYDERGLLLSVTETVGDASIISHEFVRNLDGLPIKSVDHLGFVTHFEYDPWNRISQVVYPEDETGTRAVKRYEYDQGGKVAKISIHAVNANGVDTELDQVMYSYDSMGRIIEVKKGEFTLRNFLDLDGKTIAIQDEHENTVNYEIDGVGRTRRARDIFQNERVHEFDGSGNLSSVSNNDLIESFNYDFANRVLKYTDPAQNVESYVYNNRSLRTRCTHMNGTELEMKYDPGELVMELRLIHEGQLLQVQKVERNSIGQIVNYINAENQRTEFEYNVWGDIQALGLPGSAPTQYNYHFPGLVSESLLPDGRRVEYTYNQLFQLAEISYYAPGESTPEEADKFVYDPLGRILSIENSVALVEFEYDQHDRVVRESVNGHVTEWNFDDLANTATLSYPDGRIDQFTKNKKGQLIRIEQLKTGSSALAEGLWIDYGYNSDGSLSKKEFSNGIFQNHEYDWLGRHYSFTVVDQRGNQLLSVKKVRNKSHQILAVQIVNAHAIETSSYVYDELGRLVEVYLHSNSIHFPDKLTLESLNNLKVELESDASKTLTEKYAFDTIDRRLSFKTAMDETTYSYNDANQLISIENGGLGNQSSFSYDMNGNLTEDDDYEYSYNPYGLLSGVIRKSDQTEILTFRYDGMGRLFSRSNNEGELIHYAYSGKECIQQSVENGETVQQFTLGGIGEWNNAIHGTEGDFFTLTDEQHSLLALVSNSGNVANYFSYSPFGEVKVFDESYTAQSAQDGVFAPVFSGYTYIAKIEAYQALLRTYNPTQGRFFQPDPNGYVDSPNMYCYCGQDPINFVDPLGAEKKWGFYTGAWYEDGKLTEVKWIDPNAYTRELFYQSIIGQRGQLELLPDRGSIIGKDEEGNLDYLVYYEGIRVPCLSWHQCEVDRNGTIRFVEHVGETPVQSVTMPHEYLMGGGLKAGWSGIKALGGVVKWGVGSAKAGARKIFGLTSYGRMNEAIRLARQESILLPGPLNPGNEAIQENMLRAFFEKEGLQWNLTKIGHSNQGLDGALSNFGRTEFTQIEMKIIKNWDGEIESAMKYLRNSRRFGQQGTMTYWRKQAYRMATSKVSSDEVRELGKIMLTSPRVNNYLMIMTDTGEHYMIDLTKKTMRKIID